MISPFSVTCLFIWVEKFLQTALALSSRTIGIRKCSGIEVAIPSDKNTFINVSEKLSNNKDLKIEITRINVADKN